MPIRVIKSWHFINLMICYHFKNSSIWCIFYPSKAIIFFLMHILTTPYKTLTPYPCNGCHQSFVVSCEILGCFQMLSPLTVAGNKHSETCVSLGSMPQVSHSLDHSDSVSLCSTSLPRVTMWARFTLPVAQVWVSRRRKLILLNLYSFFGVKLSQNQQDRTLFYSKTCNSVLFFRIWKSFYLWWNFNKQHYDDFNFIHHWTFWKLRIIIIE